MFDPFFSLRMRLKKGSDLLSTSSWNPSIVVCCLEESLRISGRSMNRPLLTMQTSKRPLMTVKDDPTTNKKIEEASKTLVKISTQTTEILSSVRSFDFSTLLSTVKNIQDHAFKQEEASVAWMKSSTNMA
nr:hypothetical protein [Tanacetum cinerariifolium]